MPGRARTRATRVPARLESAAAVYPARALILAAILAPGALVGCHPDPSTARARVIDFIKEFDRAEVRPARAQFQVVQHTLGGVMRASVEAPVPGRAIWSTSLPRRGVLHVYAGLPAAAAPSTVRFRIGISDHRIYEGLAEQTLSNGPERASAWTPIDVDLSRYAGPKLSLFYRPDSVTWRLVFSTDHIEGQPGVALWGEPVVETDSGAARDFLKRRVGLAAPRTSAHNFATR